MALHPLKKQKSSLALISRKIRKVQIMFDAPNVVIETMQILSEDIPDAMTNEG
jgi:hypothetical protein